MDRTIYMYKYNTDIKSFNKLSALTSGMAEFGLQGFI